MLKPLTPVKWKQIQISLEIGDFLFFAKLLRWIRQGYSLRTELANNLAFQSFFKQGLAQYITKHQGWVYGAYNPTVPGLAKIGYSRKSVRQRMQTLSNTAIPAQYKAQSSIFVYDAPHFEKIMHARLHYCKVSKEFFSISCSDLEQELNLAYQEYCHEFKSSTGISVNLINL